MTAPDKPNTPDNKGGKRAGAGRPPGASSVRRVALRAMAEIAGDRAAPAEQRIEAAQAILQAGMNRFMAVKPLSEVATDAC